MNSIRTVCKISDLELLRFIRSSKIIIFLLFLLFVNIQIVVPLRALSSDMGQEISIFECFVALSNSGIIVLILPLFFLVMISDFPNDGVVNYFYVIRCSKLTWGLGQIIYALKTSILVVLFTLISSMLLTSDFSDCIGKYSNAITKYVSVFPERRGQYVVQLIPENLYNQIPLVNVMVHSVLLLILYFFMLAMLIFMFSVMNKKIIGIIVDGIIIIAGTISCAGRTSFMWMLPMAHTIPWLHYTEYSSKPVSPISVSYIYFFAVDLLLVSISFILIKYRNNL